MKVLRQLVSGRDAMGKKRSAAPSVVPPGGREGGASEAPPVSLDPRRLFFHTSVVLCVAKSICAACLQDTPPVRPRAGRLCPPPGRGVLSAWVREPCWAA